MRMKIRRNDLLISVTASCDRLGPYDTKCGPCHLSLVSATLFFTVQLHRDFAIGFEIYAVVICASWYSRICSFIVHEV
jgi:hypothetical protein